MNSTLAIVLVRLSIYAVLAWVLTALAHFIEARMHGEMPTFCVALAGVYLGSAFDRWAFNFHNRIKPTKNPYE